MAFTDLHEIAEMFDGLAKAQTRDKVSVNLCVPRANMAPETRKAHAGEAKARWRADNIDAIRAYQRGYKAAKRSNESPDARAARLAGARERKANLGDAKRAAVRLYNQKYMAARRASKKLAAPVVLLTTEELKLATSRAYSRECKRRQRANLARAEKRRLARAAYRATGPVKATTTAYSSSEAGRAAAKRYNSSERGREVNRAARAKRSGEDNPVRLEAKRRSAREWARRQRAKQ